MRPSLPLLALPVLFLLLAGCNYQAQIQQARAEAEQSKAEAVKLKAELDLARAQTEASKSDLQKLKDWLRPIPEGGIFARPVLQKVPEFSHEFVVKPLGFTRCDFFRWRGGILEGFLQCQTDDEPVKLDFEVRKHLSKIFEARKGFDPRSVSGQIMIGCKPANKLGIFDCVAHIEVFVHSTPADKINSVGGTTYTLSGAIDPAKAKIVNPPLTGALTIEATYESPVPSRYSAFFSPVDNLAIDKGFTFYDLSIAGK